MFAGTSQISVEADGRIHVQVHFNAQGKATSAPLATRIRRYTGSQEYNSQLHVNPGDQTRSQFEWTMKMIAQGESGSFFPEDDFFLHVVAPLSPPPTFAFEPLQATIPPGQCR